MSKEGILLENFDPKPAIQKNAENARDWEYSEAAQYLYGAAVQFKDRFLDPILHTDRGRLPDLVISFDDLRNRKVLAAYTLHRNPQGLLDEITFNTAHYTNKDGKKEWIFGRWAQLETLLHEQVHLWQENFGEHKHRPGRVAHDKEFTQKCESLGLHPMPVVGCHIQVAEGVFAQLMNELGIPRPDDVPRANWTKAGGKPRKSDWFRPEKEKGRSTLHKWVCPDCGMAVRIGIGSDPHLVHDACSEIKGEKVFLLRHDGLEHTFYNVADDERETRKPTPQIIEEFNQQLIKNAPQENKDFTIERIAAKIGISKNILYEWVTTDSEFSGALERLKNIQRDDPFKTGTELDFIANSMMVVLLLFETRDRHYKAKNI